MVTRPLKRAASASFFCCTATASDALAALISASRASIRFSASAIRPSRMSSSRARLSSSCRRSGQAIEDGALGSATAPAHRRSGSLCRPAAAAADPLPVERILRPLLACRSLRRRRPSAWHQPCFGGFADRTGDDIGIAFVGSDLRQRRRQRQIGRRGLAAFRIGKIEHLLRPGLLAVARLRGSRGQRERCGVGNDRRRASAVGAESRSSNKSAAVNTSRQALATIAIGSRRRSRK